jgi:hypothetical protein
LSLVKKIYDGEHQQQRELDQQVPAHHLDLMMDDEWKDRKTKGKGNKRRDTTNAVVEQ